MTIIRLGAVMIRVTSDETVTRFRDGRCAHALHAEQEGQAGLAADLGYPDAPALNREHDVGHSLIAHMIGLPGSPTLRGVAEGVTFANWRLEEAAVLAMQKFARAMGVDLVEAAKRAGRLTCR